MTSHAAVLKYDGTTAQPPAQPTAQPTAQPRPISISSKYRRHDRGTIKSCRRHRMVPCLGSSLEAHLTRTREWPNPNPNPKPNPNHNTNTLTLTLTLKTIPVRCASGLHPPVCVLTVPSPVLSPVPSPKTL